MAKTTKRSKTGKNLPSKKYGKKSGRGRDNFKPKK